MKTEIDAGSDASVIMVSESARSCEPAGTAQQVVAVPLDFEPPSLKAAQVGIEIARDANAHVVFLHAIAVNLMPYGPANPAWIKAGLCQEAMDAVKPLLTRAQAAGVSASCSVEEGAPATVIARVAQRWGARLIVMADSKPGVIKRIFGRKIIEKVLKETSCPVVVLRQTKL